MERVTDLKNVEHQKVLPLFCSVGMFKIVLVMFFSCDQITPPQQEKWDSFVALPSLHLLTLIPDRIHHLSSTCRC